MVGTRLSAKAAAPAVGLCTTYPSGGQCLCPDGAAEGRGHRADLRLQKVPRPFSWGRDRWQTCLQTLCPGVEPPAAGA